jgi:hypothetical protein
MSLKPRLPAWRFALGTAVALLAVAAAAHTLPVSYLRLVTDADYVHFELIFNPFELSFLAEVDDNHDAELSPAELARHGQKLADRVVGAFQLSVGGEPLHPETAGIDPDLNGHHVRMRAHYKVDARQLPLTLESDLIDITSASHLVQVTYGNGTARQMAQLDSLSRKVTFTPLGQQSAAPAPVVPPKPPAVGVLLMPLTATALLVLGAGFLWFMRKRVKPSPEQRPAH